MALIMTPAAAEKLAATQSNATPTAAPTATPAATPAASPAGLSGSVTGSAGSAHAATTLYAHIDGKLRALLPGFCLEAQTATVTAALHALGWSALAMPAGQRPPHPARLNADGMPIQFAFTLAPGRAPRLQLLADPAPPVASGAERFASARAAVAQLASLFGAGAEVRQYLPWVDALVPDDDPAMLSDPAGPLWVGAAFSAGALPSLKVYANVKWGSVAGQHARMAAFAARFGLDAAWRGALERLTQQWGPQSGQLQPLGLSLVLRAGQPPAGRLYFCVPGQLWQRFETLGEHFGGRDYGGQLRRFGRTMLQDDHAYPIQSTVVSFGLGAAGTGAAGAGAAGKDGAGIGAIKIELCGQRVFGNDHQASERCSSWLRASGIAPLVFRQATTVLNGGPLSTHEHGLLAYLGIGAGPDVTSSTFYLNPSWRR